MLSGGIYFYFTKFKKLYKEFKEFSIVTFNALKDGKLTVAEKEAVLKEFSDLSPIAKEIKEKFINDAEDLGEELKETYDKIKKLVKNK
jgi:hypothetical protein